MLAAPQIIPLSRRLIGRYLAFALAGMLLCLVTTLVLVSRGVLTEFVALAAAGPVVVLLLGAVVLKQTVRRSAAIESELHRVAVTGDVETAQLRPLPGTEPSVLGWNALLDRLATQASLKALEQGVTQALRGYEDQQFHAVINSLPDGIAVTDAGGCIKLANTALAVFAAAERPEELIGEDLLLSLRCAQAANADDVRQAFAQTSRPVVAELQRSGQIEDGVWRIARHPIRRENSEPRFVWTIRDVTQQSIVNQARNDFVATATHELRTPLANIKAYAETLATHDEIDIELQKEFCNIINAEATRLSRFVDEVLDVSQIESGSFVIDRRETELDRLLNNVIEHVRPQMNQKEIDFTFKLPPKLPKLSLDKDKFQAALVNLLGNAAKYTPEQGAVTLEVELKSSQIAFHVQDSGIGIAEDDLPRVFDKFYRSDDERVTQLSGNGLGLAFTQEVVRLHGGRVCVESTLNEGSRFTIRMPVATGV